MRKIRYLSLVFVVAIIAFFSLGNFGIFGAWVYSASVSPPIALPIELGLFAWEGSEILPDQEEEGLDHVWLINNLVNGKNNKGKEIGLNNPDSDLNDYINDRLKGGWNWKRNYFGSMAVTGDDEMEELFGAAARGLSFIIEVDENDSNIYYIYTTDVYLGQRGEPNWLGTSNKTPGKPTVPIGQYIEIIYRTKLVRPNSSSDFDIVETKKGKALSDWYDENRSNANITQIPAYDVNTWVEI